MLMEMCMGMTVVSSIIYCLSFQLSLVCCACMHLDVKQRNDLDEKFAKKMLSIDEQFLSEFLHSCSK